MFPRCRVAVSLSNSIFATKLRQTLPDSVVETRFPLTGQDTGHRDDLPIVVFADLPPSDDPELERSRSKATVPVTVFVTCGEPNRHQWSEAERLGARWLIASELLDDRRCLAAAIRAAVRDPWHSDPISWGTGQACATTQIESAEHRDAIIRDLLSELGEHPLWSGSIDRYRLVAEELVNNALLHACESDRGRQYVPGSFDRLLDGDRVAVRHEINDGVFWFSVTDNGGALNGATVRGHIQRHLDVAGLLDGGGRGLFIAFALANVFALNIDRGKSTEISVVFLADRPESQKLVLINTHPDS